ncbi:hypothetical protein Sjap_024960 [Stephania japonica]|uniref:Uncharacterized protein n=1 Tax=Stephania japonica TaxID=461633 RepID=A0AAP0HKC5_9MAGN
MDGRSTIPVETRQAGIVIRSPQATLSIEDRLTAQEVQMTEVLRILRDQGAAISEMVASLTTEPPERQRLYPRLHEGNGRQGFASTERQAGQSSGAVPEQRHTEVRDEGDQFDRQRQDRQDQRDRHLGQQRGDEGQVVYITAPAPAEQPRQQRSQKKTRIGNCKDIRNVRKVNSDAQVVTDALNKAGSGYCELDPILF